MMDPRKDEIFQKSARGQISLLILKMCINVSRSFAVENVSKMDWWASNPKDAKTELDEKMGRNSGLLSFWTMGACTVFDFVKKM